MKRAFYDVRPQVFQPVGNGSYLYHWDIREEKISNFDHNEVRGIIQYSCMEAVIEKPDYSQCVSAVIRAKYTLDSEIAMINKKNAYLAKLHTDDTIESEYDEYLQFIMETKEMVKKNLLEAGITALESK